MIAAPHPLQGRIRWARQQTPETCGQACVSMLTGEPEAQVAKGLGNQGATSAWELALALRASPARWLHVPLARTVPLEEVKGLVPLAVVGLTPETGKERGHWVLWVGDAYLCPVVGEMEPAAAWGWWQSHGVRPYELLPLEVLEEVGP